MTRDDPLRARYEGKFLDALDLPEGVLVPVVVEAVALPNTEKDARGKVIDLAILAFQGKEKRLILGKTSFKVLKSMFGGDHRAWLGKKIMIQRRYLEAAKCFGVQNGLCIRVVPPVGTPILRSCAQFMGSPHPYGQPAKPAKKEPADAPPPVSSLAAFEREIEAAKDSKAKLFELSKRCSEFDQEGPDLLVRIEAMYESAKGEQEEHQT